jgi:hypothetical protein
MKRGNQQTRSPRNPAWLKAVGALMYRGDADRHTRLVVRNPQIRRVRITAIHPTAQPPDLTIVSRAAPCATSRIAPRPQSSPATPIQSSTSASVGRSRSKPATLAMAPRDRRDVGPERLTRATPRPHCQRSPRAESRAYPPLSASYASRPPVVAHTAPARLLPEPLAKHKLGQDGHGAKRRSACRRRTPTSELIGASTASVDPRTA